VPAFRNAARAGPGSCRTMENRLPMSRPVPVVDIVHDDIAVLGKLGSVLSVHGYRVCMFASAEQYRRTAEESKGFCVVIDIGLRGVVSGLDLGKAVLSSRRSIPVIFIAAAADAATREQALAMGCVAYLEHPVSSEMLISAIRRSSTPGEGGQVH
jgi:FixJ family two-component response regulator